MSLFEPRRLGSKIPNALKNNNVAASFMHLKLRRGCNEGYMKVGESKVGTGLRNSEDDVMREVISKVCELRRTKTREGVCMRQ